ncbi:MAG: M55 family metallopeptidase [Candidatus Neomarinimicrobiota bacterium]
MDRRLSQLLPLAPLLLAASLAAQSSGLKVYISADMEGVAGVVTGEQLGPSGFEYGRFRQFMTAEVLAAVEGAREAGATEILISDSHGNGQNLLIEQFSDDIQIVRAWPRPLMMMQGIDASFDAAIFIGYHAATTNPAGVRAHTFSSARLTGVYLNGVAMSEAGFNAAIAGHFNVPVVMVSGDDAIISEARALLGGVEGAVVKWAYGFHSARTLTPAAAQVLIRETVTRALENRRRVKPYRVKKPARLEVRFKNYRVVELLDYLPQVERTDAHTIRFEGSDMLEVSRFLEFILTYSPDLSP